MPRQVLQRDLKGLLFLLLLLLLPGSPFRLQLQAPSTGGLPKVQESASTARMLFRAQDPLVTSLWTTAPPPASGWG